MVSSDESDRFWRSCWRSDTPNGTIRAINPMPLGESQKLNTTIGLGMPNPNLPRRSAANQVDMTSVRELTGMTFPSTIDFDICELN